MYFTFFNFRKVFFRKSVNLRFLVKLFGWALILRKLKKVKLTFLGEPYARKFNSLVIASDPRIYLDKI
jgi:hypothetical protein